MQILLLNYVKLIEFFDGGIGTPYSGSNYRNAALRYKIFPSTLESFSANLGRDLEGLGLIIFFFVKSSLLIFFFNLSRCKFIDWN